MTLKDSLKPKKVILLNSAYNAFNCCKAKNLLFLTRLTILMNICYYDGNAY